MPRLRDTFRARARRKFDESTGVDECFNKDIFKEIDLTKGDNWEDSDAHCAHKDITTDKTCNKEFA